MRRRAFLAAGTAGLSAVVGGCSDVVPQSEQPVTHPFADATVSVRVDDASGGTHDLEDIARESLAFWNENHTEFLDFAVAFELGAGDDADVVLTFADDPEGCEAVPEFSEGILGCAPLLRAGTRAPSPVVVRVVAAERPRWSVMVTTQHEVGHVLGLNHDDEPRDIMSNRPEDRVPLYADRVAVWEAVELGSQRSGDGRRLYTHAVETWDEDRFLAAEAAFEGVRSDFEAATAAFEEATALTAAFDGDPRVDPAAVERVRSLLDRLTGRAEAGVGFATAMAAASAAAAAEDRDEVTARLEEANEYIDAYNEIAAVNLRDVALGLGLARALDEEEPVVTLDDEAV